MTTATKNEKCTADVLSKLYKYVKMGSDSIINLLPKVEEGELKTKLTKQLGGYEADAMELKKMLEELDVVPEEEGRITKMSSKIGIMMNTMIDSTASHIAQMIIEGSTMAITEITKLIREYENTSCSEKSITFARRIIEFEEKNIETMKAFL